MMNPPQKPDPILGDASDKIIDLSKAPRIQGWTVERWIEFIKEHPDCTLPGGVAGAIVRLFEQKVADMRECVIEVAKFKAEE